MWKTCVNLPEKAKQFGIPGVIVGPWLRKYATRKTESMDEKKLPARAMGAVPCLELIPRNGEEVTHAFPRDDAPLHALPMSGDSLRSMKVTLDILRKELR